MSEQNSTAVLYCRYSSHNQRDVSIDQQINSCESFAERNGIKIVRVYADRAMTGTNDKRPQFQRMIAEAASLGIQYVIVYSLDRFARDRYDSAVYKRQLKQSGVKVLSATENISDDPTGVLLESMLEGLAEYYSKELSLKIRRGMNDNASKGLVTGPPPFGYRATPDRHYEIVPEQAAIVREIFKRVLEGEPRADVIADLNRRGIKTRKGGKWSKSSFGSILKNERYVGEYIYGDTRISGGMPQIIDRETFDAMQGFLALSAMPNTPQRRRTDGGVYLLTGRVFCGHCGSPMVGLSGKSHMRVLHYYYVCKGHRYQKICDKSAVPRERLEKDVADAIKKHVLTDDMIEHLAAWAEQRSKDAEKQGPLPALLEDRKATSKAIENIIAAMEQGIVTATTKHRLLELEADLQGIDAQIAAERYANKAQAATKEDVEAALRLFQRGSIDDPAYRETLIDTFVEAVYVYDDHYEIRFHLGAGHRKEVEIPIKNDLPPSAEGSYNGDIRSPNRPYTNGATIIAVGVMSFLLICPRQTKKSQEA